MGLSIKKIGGNSSAIPHFVPNLSTEVRTLSGVYILLSLSIIKLVKKIIRVGKKNQTSFKKGHKVPKEWVEKIIKALKGRKIPEERRLKLVGRRLSEETKRKYRKIAR